MPERTNDSGFAMTSSLTSMLLSCLMMLGPAEREDAEALARAAEHVVGLQPDIRALAQTKKQRFVYLGSGPLEGLARESALKLLELTAGEVVTYFDSPLGFRHGPKSVLDGDTLVVVYVSTDPYTRRYDLDIIAEIRAPTRRGRRHGDQYRADPGGARARRRATRSRRSSMTPWSRWSIWCSPSTSRCSPRWNARRRRTTRSRPAK